MSVLEQARQRLDEARSAIAAIAADYETRISELAEDATVEQVQAVSDEFTPQLDEAEGRVRSAETQVADAERIERARAQAPVPTGTITVTEPVTYDPRNQRRSFFGDLYRAQKYQDRDAIERLQRNSREHIVEAEKRGNPVLDAEGRALSSSTTAGGDFLPPLYFGDLYAEFKRARRVYSNLVVNRQLPASGNTITIPRMTSGASTAAQTADNANLSNTDAVTASLSVPVCTVAGYADLSRQIVERSEPGLDELVLQDLYKSYNAQVNFYTVNGSGTSGQPLGVLGVSGINAITYTDASPTVPELYPKVLDGVRQITEGVFEPTVGLVMTARRWAWILASLDSSSRPLAVPNQQGPFNSVGVKNDGNASFLENMTPAGWFAGYPVYIDETIPKTLGAGTNEDRIILGAFGENILWEDQAGPRTFTFEGILSQTAGIRVEVFGYMAFTAGRYPKANSVIAGTGLAAPTF